MSSWHNWLTGQTRLLAGQQAWARYARRPQQQRWGRQRGTAHNCCCTCCSPAVQQASSRSLTSTGSCSAPPWRPAARQAALSALTGSAAAAVCRGPRCCCCCCRCCCRWCCCCYCCAADAWRCGRGPEHSLHGAAMAAGRWGQQHTRHIPPWKAWNGPQHVQVRRRAASWRAVASVAGCYASMLGGGGGDP